MDTHPSLSRIRHVQRTEKNRLRFAQAIILVFRVAFRFLEAVGPRKRRQKMRHFREKITAIESERDAILRQIKNGKVSDGLDAVHEMQLRHARPGDRPELIESQARLQSMRQESERLQSIHKASGGDKAVAAQGFRDYIAANPTSHAGHSYLAGALRQADDLDGSLVEYREALRLAGSDSIPGASSRLHLGEVLIQKGETEAAMAEFRCIIKEATPKTKPVVCMAFLQLGTALHEVGERQEARAVWKQAMQWDESKFIADKARKMLQDNP